MTKVMTFLQFSLFFKIFQWQSNIVEILIYLLWQFCKNVVTETLNPDQKFVLTLLQQCSFTWPHFLVLQQLTALSLVPRYLVEVPHKCIYSYSYHITPPHIPNQNLLFLSVTLSFFSESLFVLLSFSERKLLKILYHKLVPWF